MKTLTFFTFSGLAAIPVLAQSNTITPPAPAAPITHTSGQTTSSALTTAETDEYNRAKDTAMQQDPALGTDAKNLIDQEKASAAAGETQLPLTLQAEMAKFKTRLNKAMLAVDPKIGPVLEKMRGTSPDPKIGTDTAAPPSASGSTPIPVNAQGQ